MKNNRTFLEKLLDGAEVEWKTLDEISSIYGGLTGKGKADFENGNALYVPYKNIFNNIEIDFNNLEAVNVSDDERQYTIKYGDVLFTGSSETAEEAGMSSAVTTKTEQKIYLNSFSFGLRFNDDVELLPEFSKFLFRTLSIRKEIVKSASGVTRFNISKARFKKIKIPIPPLPVQTEIVKILDTLTVLTSELTSELTLRRKQYEYYREKLLSVDNLNLSTESIQWVKLNDLGELIRGNGLQKKDFTETGVPAIHYGQIYTYYGTFATETKSFVSPELAKKLKKAKYGDVLIAGTSENVKDVMKPLGWFGSDIAFSGDMFAFRPNKRVNTKYLTYILQTERFYKFKEKYAQGTKVIRVKADNFLNYEIPLPTFEEQQRIVSTLDKFETLTNSITEGLPLAIEQSQKRYEYYRELLLSFNGSN